MNYVLIFEIISQTDLKCAWAAQKNVTKEKYRDVPIKEMPCFKDKVKECQLQINDNTIYNFFYKKAP